MLTFLKKIKTYTLCSHFCYLQMNQLLDCERACQNL